jgi:hypothetical protein
MIKYIIAYEIRVLLSKAYIIHVYCTKCMYIEIISPTVRYVIYEMTKIFAMLYLYQYLCEALVFVFYLYILYTCEDQG